MKENDMRGARGPCGGEERCVQGLGGKNETKRSLGRPRYRWENIIINKSSNNRIGGCGLDLAGSG
jgi:hypothetical protein